MNGYAHSGELPELSNERKEHAEDYHIFLANAP